MSRIDGAYFSSLIDDLGRRAARAVMSELGPANSALQAHLRERLEQPAGIAGSFLADPVFEALFGWERVSDSMKALAGKLVHPRVVEAMDRPPAELRDYRFDARWKPYRHQLQAWQELQATPPRSVLVASGTGSGKTECFLVPIIDALAREHEKERRIQGVRALFLYPLNALINSQRDRLRAWLAPFGGALRFCLYNGETPETVPASKQAAQPEQVLSRKLLRDDPPPILVTNGTMLEYMLVRKDDEQIVSKSHGQLRWIVLDEAHSYIGSQAAEIALLLRRVLHAFGVRSEDVHFVATSATIGEASDERARRMLQRFLADIAGVDPSRVSVIEGPRAVPPIPKPSPTQKVQLDLDRLSSMTPEDRFRVLAGDARVLALRDRLAKQTDRLASLTAQYFGKPEGKLTIEERQHVLRLLDLSAAASENGQALLPLRAHLFHRTQPGLWCCCNAGCRGKQGTALESGWNFGKLFLERRERCDACEAPVYELVLCYECGAHYLAAEELVEKGGESRLIPRVFNREEDEFEAEIEPIEESDQEAAKDVVETAGLPRLLVDGDTTATMRTSLDPVSRMIGSTGGIEVRILHADDGILRCTRCGTAERGSGELFRPARVGAPFFLGIGIPILLDYTPSADLDPHVGPCLARRLITFSDSRQGTARFAVKAQLDAERSFVRSFLYHQVAASRREPSRAEVERIRQDLEQLQGIQQSSPVIKRLIQERRTQLEAITRPVLGRLSWIDAVNALSKTREVQDWMPAQWSHLALRDLARGQEAAFCLLREFMRRPKRQASLETLGLLAIDYPAVNEVEPDSMPVAWKRRNLTLDDWRDFLRISIDFWIRANAAVEVPYGLLRWMGSPVRTSFVAGPQAERVPRVIPLPLAHRARGRRPARLPLLLFRVLGLDVENTVDQAEVNEILDAAWAQIGRVLKRFKEGSQLDLVGAAELVEVREAWLCPVTHRVLNTTLRGWTPYLTPDLAPVEAQCRKLSMPELPHAYWQEASGRRVPPAQVQEWLETDERVVECRGLGVWNSYADRIAAFADYFRVAEHSAQLSGTRLQSLEEQFKSGKLNVLSCSTTMELGVDIGGLSTVAMNNAPPGPANFRQRAGRAGRRGEARAVSFTLCKGTPHGEAVFASPLWPFTEATYVPTVSLQSERIIQRHIDALALTRFLGSVASDLPRLTAGWFLEERADGVAPHRRFFEWLSGNGTRDEWLIDGMRNVIRRTIFDGIDPVRLLASTSLDIQTIAVAWNDKLQALSADLAMFGTQSSQAKVKSAAELAISRQIARLRDEYLLRELVGRGFLPGHGFPTSVVPFITTTLEQLRQEEERRRRRTGTELQEREDSIGRSRGYPSRDLPLAIRDYSPGSDVVLDGQVFRSGGVTLNWHIPPGDTEVHEAQVLRWAWRCRRCGASETHATRIQQCPVCDAEGERIRQWRYLQPSGFAVDLRAEPTNDVSSVRYIPVRPPWISAGLMPWSSLPRPELGRYRYSPQGHIFYRTTGLFGHGFAICLRCGRAAAEPGEPGAPPPEEMNDHSRLRGGKDQDGQSRCDGNDNHWSLKRHLWLGAAFHTDVFEMQLHDPSTGLPLSGAVAEKAAYSLAVALRQALAEHLGINARELGCDAVPSRSQAGSGTWSVVLYDTASGGAGFVAAAARALPELLVRAKQVLQCRRQCDAACHACLLDYDTQFMIERLDRNAALTVMTDALLGGLELPEADRVFGFQSQLEFDPLRLAVGRELQRADTEEIRLYLGGGIDHWDIAGWPIRDDLLRFSGGKRRVILIAPQETIAALPPDVVNPLASVIEVGGIELVVTKSAHVDPHVPNLIAEVSGSNGTVRWSATDADALAPGPAWGTGGSHSRTIRVRLEKKLPVVGGVCIEPSKIRRPPENTVRQSLITSELDGPIVSFGSRFWNVLRTELPSLDAQLRDGQVREVCYTDRYVNSPLLIRLLREIVKSLPNASARVGALRLHTSYLNTSYAKTPESPEHSWRAEREREDVAKLVLAGVADELEFKVERYRETPHYRELSVTWIDGRSWKLRLDYGLGFLLPRQRVRFPFDHNSERQAHELVIQTFEIRNPATFPALLYLSDVR